MRTTRLAGPVPWLIKRTGKQSFAFSEVFYWFRYLSSSIRDSDEMVFIDRSPVRKNEGSSKTTRSIGRMCTWGNPLS
jgi:hypothetical protein